jgi:hypothetical protein
MRGIVMSENTQENKKKCFVIQPLGETLGKKFVKRYQDVYEPVLQECGYEPIRVDKMSMATDLVQAIKDLIRDADMCLADITVDNPNVFFELGYAFAVKDRKKDEGKELPVLLLCARRERDGGLPFDIQNYGTIFYGTDSIGDFNELKRDIMSYIKKLPSSLKCNQVDSTEAVTNMGIYDNPQSISPGTWFNDTAKSQYEKMQSIITESSKFSYCDQEWQGGSDFDYLLQIDAIKDHSGYGNEWNDCNFAVQYVFRKDKKLLVSGWGLKL